VRAPAAKCGPGIPRQVIVRSQCHALIFHDEFVARCGLEIALSMSRFRLGDKRDGITHNVIATGLLHQALIPDRVLLLVLPLGLL
jgi:hypothetical protein